MTSNASPVPWTDEQWARVNQVVQEEASRARVAGSFLPLFGPLPPDADFVRSGEILYPALPDVDRRRQTHQISIDDTATLRLATLQVKVYVRGAQMADADMTSVLALFRRAANLLARLEDAAIFNGLEGAGTGFLRPRGGTDGLGELWEILGRDPMAGLLNPVLRPESGRPEPLTTPVPGEGDALVRAVSQAIGTLEGRGQFGPFAVALGPELFLFAQSPEEHSLVLPQDRILPFLGGGPLLRSSTITGGRGVIVALGAAPVELVVATDMGVQFLQVTTYPMFVFRVFERIVLRIKETNAISQFQMQPSPPSQSRERPRGGSKPEKTE